MGSVDKPIDIQREKKIVSDFLDKFKSSLSGDRDALDLFEIYASRSPYTDKVLADVNYDRAQDGLPELTMDDYERFVSHLENEFLLYRTYVLEGTQGNSNQPAIDVSRENLNTGKSYEDLYGNPVSVGDTVVLLPTWQGHFDFIREWKAQRAKTSAAEGVQRYVRADDRGFTDEFQYGLVPTQNGAFVPYKDILLYEKVNDRPVPMLIVTVAKNAKGEWGLLAIEDPRRTGFDRYIEMMYGESDVTSLQGLNTFLKNIVSFAKEMSDEDTTVNVAVKDAGTYLNQISPILSSGVTFARESDAGESITYLNRGMSGAHGTTPEEATRNFITYLLGQYDAVGVVVDMGKLPNPDRDLYDEEIAEDLQSKRSDYIMWFLVKLPDKKVLVPYYDVVRKDQMDKLEKDMADYFGISLSDLNKGNEILNVTHRSSDNIKMFRDACILVRAKVYNDWYRKFGTTTKISMGLEAFLDQVAGGSNKVFNKTDGSVYEVSNDQGRSDMVLLKDEDGNEVAVPSDSPRLKDTFVPVEE